MLFHSRTLCCAISCSSVAAALTPAVVAAAPAVPSPLSVRGADGNEVVTRLVLDPVAYESLKSTTDVVLTGFRLGSGAVVNLDLHRVEVFSPNAVLVSRGVDGDTLLPRPDVLLLSGRVAGEADSIAFLGLSPHGSNGFIQRDGQTHVISSGRDGRDPTIVYEVSALPPGAITWTPWQCMTDELPDAVPAGGSGGGGVAGVGGLPCRLADIAIETDLEYLNNLFGGDTGAALAYIATLIGATSEIYVRDVGSRFAITYVRLWDGVLFDPWSQGSTTDQLFEFRDYWQENEAGVDRDVAHFLSGRNLGGGVAWLPGLCLDNFAYGLSANLNGFFPYPLEDHNGQNWDIEVVAHELGHNFGAPHTHNHNPQIDNCAGGDCADADQGTIMSYCHLCPGGIANMNLHFHPMIIDDMLAYLDDDAPCNLEVINGPDLSGDGFVNITDLLQMLSGWGTCPAGPCPGDLDCDGKVNITDLLQLLSSWT